MGKKFYQNEKFQKLFYPTLYFVFAVAFIISACFLFDGVYYQGIYVSGTSMEPTLIGTGERVHYGLSDNSAKAVDNLERFDVVITSYPASWGSPSDKDKIKRVWGFPGESISLENSNDGYVFTVKHNDQVVYTVTSINHDDYSLFQTPRRSFNVRNYNRSFDVTLGQNEYWLMGDNWLTSSDSYGHEEKITRSNLVGKVVRIVGTAVIVNGKATQVQKIANMYYF